MLAILVAALAVSTPAFDPTVAPDKLVVLCDPVRYRFSVRNGADAASVDRSYPRRTLIAVDDLMFPLPGWTNEIDVMGPLTRYVRCGPYTVRLTGDAYNTNVQGESGAYPPFASMVVLRGNFILYPKNDEKVRLVECERSLPRARPCPEGYAVRVDGQYDPRGKRFVVTETTASTLESDSERQVATRRMELEDDLTSWQPDEEDAAK